MDRYLVRIQDDDGAEHDFVLEDDWMKEMETKIQYEALERSIRFVRIVEIEWMEET